MIVDAHTHIFPPSYIERRSELCRRDATFGELYANPRAKLATAEDLLASMDHTGINHSVVLGFAWREPALCRAHNDYLLESACEAGGRLLPFCTLPMCSLDAAYEESTRCASGGARGFGELRPESQGASLDDENVAGLLEWIAAEHGKPLLIHASEPVGHPYPGKQGQSLGPLYRFIAGHPRVLLIAAHWGGGLPLFALMPELRQVLQASLFDTAATTLLYDAMIYRVVADLLGADHILFGSDFPLLSPKKQLENLRNAPLDDEERLLALGLNASRLFGLQE